MFIGSLVFLTGIICANKSSCSLFTKYFLWNIFWPRQIQREISRVMLLLAKYILAKLFYHNKYFLEF